MAEIPAIKENCIEDVNYELIKSIGEECVTTEELKTLLVKKPRFTLYDGFEPSGRMHIAQGIFKAINVNKCTKAGGKFIFWIADWFALMNDKMGGDPEKIKTVGKYFIEVWKSAGMDMENVVFLWSSEEITKNAEAYWSQMLDIARVFTVARIKKCCTSMGRKQDTLTAAQILYPIMQCTDIFFLKADICQLGLDQRKVNMLAREYCDYTRKTLKPVILSHHMLSGLKEHQAKMSKSDPESSIWMEDSEEDIYRKIKNAYCPQGTTCPRECAEGLSINPCLDYLRHIIFSFPGSSFEVGEHVYTDFESVKNDFLSGKLSEETFKNSLALALNKIIQPVRDHFIYDDNARNLLSLIKEYKKESTTFTDFHDIRVTSSELVHVVFSPLASDKFTLGQVLTIIRQLESAPEGSEIVFWIRDWSSFCENRFKGNKNTISAAYILLTEALVALVPKLMSKVRIVKQSEAILANPSNYWLNVINCGRKFPLSKIFDGTSSNESVSQVITSLMHVIDVLSTAATTIACTDTGIKLHQLAVDYHSLINLSSPKICIVNPIVTQLSPFQREGCSQDIDIYLCDTITDVKRKLNKTFCEPRNISYCPPITLASDISFHFGTNLLVKRKDSNGGDKTYNTIEELISDFESGALHPGDLKPSVSNSITELFGKILNQYNTQKCKTALSGILNFIKREQNNIQSV
jgi:tyrosyl-tRNA synthetase